MNRFALVAPLLTLAACASAPDEPAAKPEAASTPQWVGPSRQAEQPPDLGALRTNAGSEAERDLRLAVVWGDLQGHGAGASSPAAKGSLSLRDGTLSLLGSLGVERRGQLAARGASIAFDVSASKGPAGVFLSAHLPHFESSAIEIDGRPLQAVIPLDPVSLGRGEVVATGDGLEVAAIGFATDRKSSCSSGFLVGGARQLTPTMGEIDGDAYGADGQRIGTLSGHWVLSPHDGDYAWMQVQGERGENRFMLSGRIGDGRIDGRAGLPDGGTDGELRALYALGEHGGRGFLLGAFHAVCE